jgi:hypothetical protein
VRIEGDEQERAVRRAGHQQRLRPVEEHVRELAADVPDRAVASERRRGEQPSGVDGDRAYRLAGGELRAARRVGHAAGQQRECEAGVHQQPRAGERAGVLLHGDRELDETAALAAVLLRSPDPQPAVCRGERAAAAALAPLDPLAHALHRRLARERAAHGVAQHQLLVGEREAHGVLLCCVSRG